MIAAQGQAAVLRRGTGPDLGPHATAFEPRERTLLGVLRRRAAEAPEAPWLRFDGGPTWTVGEVSAEVQRIAAGLARLGVGSGEHVGLLMGNRIEFVAGMLGTFAAGCISVPINAREHGETLTRLLADSEISALLTAHDQLRSLRTLAPPPTLRRVVVADLVAGESWEQVPLVPWSELRQPAGPAPAQRQSDSSELALIQYTSGTTGGAKGAMYSHHLLYMYSALSVDALGWTPADVLMTPLPMYHAAALHHVAMGSLHVGCQGALRSRFSASRFWQQAGEDQANFVVLMGPMAAMLQARAAPSTDHPVREVFCTPPPPDKAEFQRRFGVQVLWQTYGMTECYPVPMRRDHDDQDPVTAVGHPAAWTEYGVVDERGWPLPAGERGELVFRPRIPHMAIEGYWRRDAETARAFRDFVFHTGDIGFFDEDGLLHLLGRTADRIRRRGENVAAQSIERVALLAPGVVEAAAYGIPSPLGEDDVKLDVTGDPELPALQAHLRANLPGYMLPRYYERRAAFPKTGSERVIKGRLRELGIDRHEVVDMERTPALQAWPECKR